MYRVDAALMKSFKKDGYGLEACGVVDGVEDMRMSSYRIDELV